MFRGNRAELIANTRMFILLILLVASVVALVTELQERQIPKYDYEAMDKMPRQPRVIFMPIMNENSEKLIEMQLVAPK
ncbi:hypothetical protein THF1C08_320077 [Vibrio jasicida]|jgi:hypothetical protein|uniref:Uncharacterized protein n=1 Tax=Vibrio jasicida TaxID=766224 RepID=A0AAU9QSU1_9VIBR|nr:hypothetical protein THF1C08_320077 [Vibrio jasicida]CAH1597493.1 hypothetical protein THF1A12_320077 [Vibrio jasicida]